MGEYLAKSMGIEEVESAGVHPSASVYFMAIDSLAEINITVDSNKKPETFESKLTKEWDIIISLDPEATSIINTFNLPKTTKLITWDIKDPSGYPIEYMNAVRDEIKSRIKGFEREKTG